MSQQAYTIGIPFLILSALAFVFAGQDDHIGRWEGIGFLSIYMVFILMIAGVV